MSYAQGRDPVGARNADMNSQSRIAHYHKAKGHADHHLVESELEYTIICPGGLRDDEGSGLVSVSSDLDVEGTTSRENLAAALVMCLDLDNTIGKRFSMLEGDTPLEEALRSMQ